MAGGREKRVAVKRSTKVDWLSNLPESLLCKVLLNLSTVDVVRTSVLSKRWRNLWRYIPGLDVDDEDFPDYKTFVSFVDAFLGFNSESYLESFTLNYSGKFREDPEIGDFSRWINTLVDRRVKHLNILDTWSLELDTFIPPSLYTCGSLVSLELSGVALASPMFVSLPCLQFMNLTIDRFANVLDLENLISGCPVLESLSIQKSSGDGIKVLRVCSESLLRFTHVSDDIRFSFEEDLVIEINTPKLQYLSFSDNSVESLILSNTSSLVEAYIDIGFNRNFKNSFENDLQKRKMIGSFLVGISCVKNLTITSGTLEAFDRVLLFDDPELGILSGPSCLLPSLEYVDIKRPMTGVAMEMKLVSYFLETSATLKKLTIRLSASLKTKESAKIFKELLAIPRLSSSCQVVVL